MKDIANYIMKRELLLIIAIFMSALMPAFYGNSNIFAYPQAHASEKKKVDFATLKEAVKLAAQIDAYNDYCDAKAKLGTGFINKFTDKADKSEAKKRDELEKIRKESFDRMKIRLNEKQMECRSTDLLLEKFSIMQQVKELSYKLLGIDPKLKKLNGEPKAKEKNKNNKKQEAK